MDHDTYLVEEVQKIMPIKLISCQYGIQTCMLEDISKLLNEVNNDNDGT